MNPDFIDAVRQEFCEALEDAVDPDILSPQVCWDPLIAILGKDFDSGDLVNLGPDGIERLRAEFSNWFESDEISHRHLEEAIGNTLARWPA